MRPRPVSVKRRRSADHLVQFGQQFFHPFVARIGANRLAGRDVQHFSSYATLWNDQEKRNPDMNWTMSGTPCNLEASPRRSLILSVVLALFCLGWPQSEAKPVAGAADHFLAGRLLVASKSLDDPTFHHAVILMVHHNREGAFGLIVNRRSRALGIGELLQMAGLSEEKEGAKGALLEVHDGGPVGKWQIFVIHSPDFSGPSTTVVNSQASVTDSPDVLRAIAVGRGPKNVLIVFGYAGWGPGQLESELSIGSWVIAPSDAETLFQGSDDGKWAHAYSRKISDP